MSQNFPGTEYCDTIAGSCKNNSQKKNQKNFKNYEPNQTNKQKFILEKKLINGKFGFFLAPTMSTRHRRLHAWRPVHELHKG